jgi:hypothetical protein
MGSTDCVGLQHRSGGLLTHLLILAMLISTKK